MGCKNPVAVKGDALGPHAATLEDTLRVRDSQESLTIIFWKEGDKVLFLPKRE